MSCSRVPDWWTRQCAEVEEAFNGLYLFEDGAVEVVDGDVGDGVEIARTGRMPTRVGRDTFWVYVGLLVRERRNILSWEENAEGFRKLGRLVYAWVGRYPPGPIQLEMLDTVEREDVIEEAIMEQLYVGKRPEHPYVDVWLRRHVRRSLRGDLFIMGHIWDDVHKAGYTTTFCVDGCEYDVQRMRDRTQVSIHRDYVGRPEKRRCTMWDKYRHGSFYYTAHIEFYRANVLLSTLLMGLGRVVEMGHLSVYEDMLETGKMSDYMD